MNKSAYNPKMVLRRKGEKSQPAWPEPDHPLESRPMIGYAHGFQSNDGKLRRARHFDSGTQDTTRNAQKRSW